MFVPRGDFLRIPGSAATGEAKGPGELEVEGDFVAEEGVMLGGGFQGLGSI
jgi:hypothetical protein